MRSLKDIAKHFGTDKEVDHHSHGSGHQYCNFYDEHLSKIRLEKLKIFEIGIFDGASLKMWQEYFPNSLIYGIDLLVEPNCVLINEGRIKSFKLDAGNKNNLLDFKKEHGPFDIVIDDGSHFTNHQFISWDVFNEDCRFFIWEDLHTSRMPHYMRGMNDRNEHPLDMALRLCHEDPSRNFLFDKDNDEKHVTFLRKNL